jgi:alkanesulfonate monooxygenase SsuD/methylene tetrahydromethanopterin reductase-like flavin-dependent oxidoreductase (luciferase family)
LVWAVVVVFVSPVFDEDLGFEEAVESDLGLCCYGQNMGSAPLRIGLKLGQDATVSELQNVWRIAEDAVFDHLWCLDVFAAIGSAGPDRPIFEALSLQAAMAVTTNRIRIGCSFTGNTHRPPWQLAKMAVTVDHLSDGRLEFGIGAGYDETEHRMFDIGGLDHRVGRLSESLQCIKLLWTEERVDFNGRYYKLRDAVANPKPVQKPLPPIWIGARGDQMLRLVARHADVWNCAGSPDIAQFNVAAEKLDTICVEIGRDPTTIRRLVQIRWNGQDPQRLAEECAAWLAAGCTEQIIYLLPLEMGSLGPVRAAEAAANVLPELRKVAGNPLA